LNSPKLNNSILGWVLGLIGPAIGFLIFGLIWSTYYRRTFTYLYKDIVLQFSELHSPVLTLSLVFNLLIFLLFNKYNHLKTARGILGATFLYVPVVFYLKFA
jgi:hypothetical protein